MKFTKATRKQAKLRLALTGPSGSGKTYSALLMASGMGGKIAVIDTERSSASLYSHLVEFDALDLAPPYTPERFIQAIEAAEEAGYDILVVDSITHEWSGVGGCLELVDEVARSKYKGNSWSAWNDITPRHRSFLDKMMASNLHIIATMRSKTDTAQVDEGGRKRVVKLGMKSEQRDGAEYEFTIVLDLVHDGHFATASKDRTGLFSGDPKPISAETGQRVAELRRTTQARDAQGRVRRHHANGWRHRPHRSRPPRDGQPLRRRAARRLRAPGRPGSCAADLRDSGRRRENRGLVAAEQR